jgi:hypothetical protein
MRPFLVFGLVAAMASAMVQAAPEKPGTPSQAVNRTVLPVPTPTLDKRADNGLRYFVRVEGLPQTTQERPA